jgi:hypothetical protein
MKKQRMPHEVERLHYLEGDVRCVLQNCRGAPRRVGTTPETGCNSPHLKVAVHSIVRTQFRPHRGDAGCSGHRVSLLRFHCCCRLTVGGNPGRALIQNGLMKHALRFLQINFISIR